jgi:hypothetical protein
VNDISSRAAAVLEGLPNNRQAALLAQMAHNLTVTARDDLPGDGMERLRRYNELQHLLTAQVSALLKGNEYRYPTRTLLDIMVEKAGTDAIGLSLCESISWAFSRALEQDDRL